MRIESAYHATERESGQKAALFSFENIIGFYTDWFQQNNMSILNFYACLAFKGIDTDCEENPIEKKLVDHQGKSKRYFPCSPVNISCEQKQIVTKVQHPNCWRFFSKGKGHQIHLNDFLTPCLPQCSTQLASQWWFWQRKHKPLRSRKQNTCQTWIFMPANGRKVPNRSDFVQRTIPSPDTR